MAKKSRGGRVTERSTETVTTISRTPNKNDGKYEAERSTETVTTTSTPNRNRGKYAPGRHVVEETRIEQSSKTEEL